MVLSKLLLATYASYVVATNTSTSNTTADDGSTTAGNVVSGGDGSTTAGNVVSAGDGSTTAPQSADSQASGGDVAASSNAPTNTQSNNTNQQSADGGNDGNTVAGSSESGSQATSAPTVSHEVKSKAVFTAALPTSRAAGSTFAKTAATTVVQLAVAFRAEADTQGVAHSALTTITECAAPTTGCSPGTSSVSVADTSPCASSGDYSSGTYVLKADATDTSKECVELSRRLSTSSATLAFETKVYMDQTQYTASAAQVSALQTAITRITTENVISRASAEFSSSSLLSNTTVTGMVAPTFEATSTGSGGSTSSAMATVLGGLVVMATAFIV